MAIEKRWPSVGPIAVTAPGTANGQLTLSSVINLKVKQRIQLLDPSFSTLSLEIKRIVGPHLVMVGIVGSPITSRFDVSSYGITSSVFAPEQPRNDIPLQEIERAVYEEEPIVAIRSIPVDDKGVPYGMTNPMPVSSTLPAPTGLATEAKQDTQITVLDNILTEVTGVVPAVNNVKSAVDLTTTAVNDVEEAVDDVETAILDLPDNNLRTRILAATDRIQNITYEDFGTKNQRITQIDYSSPSVSLTQSAIKTIIYTLDGSSYRRDSIVWSLGPYIGGGGGGGGGFRTYSAANVGSEGVGVYSATDVGPTDTEFQFKNIVEASTKISVTNNPTNKTIEIDANISKSDVGLSAVPNVDATDPGNISQDTTHRFATDTEKSTWSGSDLVTYPMTAYTTPANINTNTRFKLTLIGGGGAGGGSPSSNNTAGGGGGSGGCGYVFITGLAPSTSYNVNIGLGGIGATNALGGDGGDTTIQIGTTTYVAGGGKGGDTHNGARGAAGGDGGATLNLIDIGAQKGQTVGGASTATVAGFGGSNIFGRGGMSPIRPNNDSTAGNMGVGYGAGGSGSISGSTSTTDNAGGAGLPGVILIEWHN